MRRVLEPEMRRRQAEDQRGRPVDRLVKPPGLEGAGMRRLVEWGEKMDDDHPVQEHRRPEPEAAEREPHGKAGHHQGGEMAGEEGEPRSVAALGERAKGGGGDEIAGAGQGEAVRVVGG